jgi:hypothetical protein
MQKLLEIFKNILSWLILVFSLYLVFLSGFGISGTLILTLFTFIVFLFIWLALFQDHEHISLSYKSITSFVFKYFLILLIFMYWISLCDYYLVELFKIVNINIDKTVYWNVFFGALVGSLITLITFVYYSGSNHLSNSIRISVLAAFIINSNLNDLLYYIIYNQSLPQKWTWLHQPQFLFGDSITSTNVIIWCLISIVMGFVLALLPYEILVSDSIDSNNDFKKSKLGSEFEKIILFILVFASIGVGQYFFVPKIIKNLDNLKKETYITAKDKAQSYNSASTSDDSILALQIIQELNKTYIQNGSYPISTSNCKDGWDSSFKSLPIKTSIPYESKQCEISNSNKVVMYYSDGNRFALIMPGQNTSPQHPNLYSPGKRDVKWFDTSDSFYKSWNWDTTMLVYQYQKNIETTQFI